MLLIPQNANEISRHNLNHSCGTSTGNQNLWANRMNVSKAPVPSCPTAHNQSTLQQNVTCQSQVSLISWSVGGVQG